MTTSSHPVSNHALYAGTFDPITLGHLDVIETASTLFSKLVIAIGKNPQKATLFTEEERNHMVRKTCSHLGNVEVDTFKGLVANYAKKRHINVFVRGLRTEADYVYEMQMAMMNKNLQPSIHTIFIPTKQMHSHISSTLVKEVAFLGGDIANLVPKNIQKALLAKTPTQAP
ncbi:MAG: pantetheine-phosphate adenylyltransferase [Proteobacteria bacterium]|nr:pantetheine-phosphate adenylyltransferase [Pseudomonadota bacterium]